MLKILNSLKIFILIHCFILSQCAFAQQQYSDISTLKNIDDLINNGHILDLSNNTALVHKQNSTFKMSNFRLSSIIKYSFIKPLKLDSSFDRPITLKEALSYALENNLPIKISKESYNYQNYQLYGNGASALPSVLLSYNRNYYDVTNHGVTANSNIFQARVNYPVFQGGAILYSILGQYYRVKGWRSAYYTTVNDALLDVYLKYSNLMLNYSLLQIRARAVAVSAAQLQLNKSMFKAGTGTKFAVMQSMSQLATDRQAYLQQQVTLRQSSIALAFSLNFPMGANLIPSEDEISEIPIVDTNLNIQQLLNMAFAHRPELQQYQYFKLASNRNVQVTASPLYPAVSLYTSYSHSNVTASLSSSSNDSTTSAAKLSKKASSSSSSSSSISGAGIFPGVFDTYQQGLSISTYLNGFGLVNVANILSTKTMAKQSQMQANQELIQVVQQVRSDYFSMLISREQIDNAAYGYIAANDALRLAKIRLQTGVGTNLELIQAQRDYVNSMITRVQAIIANNQAQAQLLHDIGIISFQTLTKSSG